MAINEILLASKPIRALFIDHTAQLGGGEIALLELLPALDRELIEPVALLFSDGPLKERLQASGIPTHLLPTSKELIEARKDSMGGSAILRLRTTWEGFRTILMVRKFIRQEKFQIAHTNSLKADILGGLAARMAGVKLVWHLRDRIEPDYLPDSVVRILRLLCRVIPDYLVANSESTLETLSLHGRRPGMVIYSGVGNEWFEASPPPCLTSNSPHIGIVGRITEWKGQHIFLEAAGIVLKSYPEARFQIVGAALFGEEAYEARIREMADQEPLKGRVEFLGFRKDVLAVMSGLDIVAHASITPEPFGQVVVQGMALGRPVVGTDAGGVRETMVNGETGLLVPPGDSSAMAEALCSLLADPERARQMGQCGKERAKRLFSVERAARQLEELYSDLQKH